MNERDFLDFLAERGLSDDAAVLAPTPGEEWVVSIDAQLEDVHFRRRWADAPTLAVRALAAAASDVAAMGGSPRWFLSTFLLPDLSEAEAIWEAVEEAARRWGFAPAGGDTCRSERLGFDFCVVGSVPKGRALRRSGARAGDVLVISDAVGVAARGLADLEAGRRETAAARSYLAPVPRIEAGLRLREANAHAAIDVSDGLGVDLDRLARASGVVCVVERVPVDPRVEGVDEVAALSSGEEYALVAAVAPDVSVEGFVRFGRVEAASECAAGAYYRGQPIGASGYDHFKK